MDEVAFSDPIRLRLLLLFFLFAENLGVIPKISRETAGRGGMKSSPLGDGGLAAVVNPGGSVKSLPLGGGVTNRYTITTPRSR